MCWPQTAAKNFTLPCTSNVLMVSCAPFYTFSNRGHLWFTLIETTSVPEIVSIPLPSLFLFFLVPCYLLSIHASNLLYWLESKAMSSVEVIISISCRDAFTGNRNLNGSKIYDFVIALDTTVTLNYPIFCEKINYRFNLDEVTSLSYSYGKSMTENTWFSHVSSAGWEGLLSSFPVSLSLYCCYTCNNISWEESFKL